MPQSAITRFEPIGGERDVVVYSRPVHLSDPPRVLVKCATGPCGLKCTRAFWIWLSHLACAAAHLAAAVATLVQVASGNDYAVQLYRVRVAWDETQRGGYRLDLVAHGSLDLAWLCAAFFLLSLCQHLMWVVCGPWEWSICLLWQWVDQCLSWWCARAPSRDVARPPPAPSRAPTRRPAPARRRRWCEYFFSASVMAVAVAITVGIRETYALVAIAALIATTMLFGLLTEFAAAPTAKGTQWAPADAACGRPSAWRAHRLVPHVCGWVPYATAWFIILHHFATADADHAAARAAAPDDEPLEAMPDFVRPVVWGTFAIFTTFAFVQVRYQCVDPTHYWKTELWYNALSATAKLYLGGFIYANVLLLDCFDEGMGADGCGGARR